MQRRTIMPERQETQGRQEQSKKELWICMTCGTKHYVSDHSELGPCDCCFEDGERSENALTKDF